MAVSLWDAAQAEGVRRTRDGYLVADVRIARSGIYHYAGVELGRPDMPLVRVLRPESEVFKPSAMSGFAFRPLTNDHPTEAVTSKNWKDVAVGMLGGDVARDGEFLRVPLVMMDAAAIADFEAGKRSLSAGYTCDIEWSAGTLEDGTEFDAIQRNITANHLSLVDRGRAGSECAIPSIDAAPQSPTPECRVGAGPQQRPTDAHTHRTSSTNPSETEVPLRKLSIDGLSVEFTDQGAEAVMKLQAQLQDAKAATDTALARVQEAEAERKRIADGYDGQIAALKAEQARLADAHAGEVAALKAAHEQALEAKDGEIAALRVQTSDEALDARVAARTALVAQAKRVLGDAFDPSGKSDAEIRKTAVVKALGDKLTDVESRSDAYFTAAFDAVTVMAPASQRPDPLRNVIAAGGGNGAPPVNDAKAPGAARQAYLNAIQSAWQHPAGKETV